MTEAGAPMEKLRFDPAYNAGQIATVLSIIVLFGGLVFQQGRFQATTETRLAAAEAIRAQYIPIVNGMAATADVTNDRLNNIAVALTGIRGEVSALGGEVSALSGQAGAIRERLVAIETTLKVTNPDKQGFNELKPPVTTLGLAGDAPELQ